MDSAIALEQLTQIKNTLVFDITKNSTGVDGQILFQNPISFVRDNNPSVIYNVFGFDKGQILFDNYQIDNNPVDIYSLPIECLIKVKEQIEFYLAKKILL